MNEDNQITQIIAHKTFRIALGVLLLLLILFALHYCNSKPQPINFTTTNTDSLNTIIAEKNQVNEFVMQNNKELRIKLDSINKVKPKIVHHYHTVYDSLIIADTACVNSLVTLYNQCAKVDSVNEYIIANQSSQIGNLISVTNNQQDIIDIRNYQHSVDSVNEVVLKQTIKDEVSNGKRKYRKGLLQGGVIGLGVGVIGGILLVK